AYDITAYLHGHTIDAQVLEILPMQTVSIDFMLYYLDPPYNLNYDLNGNTAALAWCFDSGNDEDFLHFNVFRKVLDFCYTLIATTTEPYYETDINPNLDYYFYVEAVYSTGTSDPSNEIAILASDVVEESLPELTDCLSQNYPNPFNPVTVIAYAIAEAGPVTLNIYNIRGELVRTLIDQYQSAGEKTVLWDGTDNTGNKLGNGIYFYKLNTTKNSSIKKMMMLK
ncbi:MAG: T9SS type A sorting domain-containing protein, partial [Candidatus Cloacimonetes bacterium]|nr:T9SS type A sorting domain-containing protein [Candidatus Cloacimonadota bacterium]